MRIIWSGLSRLMFAARMICFAYLQPQYLRDYDPSAPKRYHECQ